MTIVDRELFEITHCVIWCPRTDGFYCHCESQCMSPSSGPARFGKRGTQSYTEWLGKKQSAEQKIIDVRKAEEERRKLEEEERYVLVPSCWVMAVGVCMWVTGG